MYKYTQIGFAERKGPWSVFVYYSKDGEKFRQPTGVKVDKKNILKSGAISSNHPSYAEDSETIKSVQDRLENLVIAYVKKYGEKPSKSWVQNEWEKPLIDAKKDLQDALCYWTEFVEAKKLVVRNDGTIKRYNNLFDTVNKFRKKKNYAISFNNLDQKFFNAFLNYMVNEHEYVRNKNQRELDAGVLPEIGLANDTAIKRLNDFVEYLKYSRKQMGGGLDIEAIKDFIKHSRHKLEVRKQSDTTKWEVTLTPHEIQFCINLDHFEPEFYSSLSSNQRRYLDILLFMCLQGTAPIDTKSISKTDIVGGKIAKDRSKTGNQFKVELDPVAEEILIRNNYDLNFTDQTLNDAIKKLFVSIFELYRAHYEKEFEEAYVLMYTQRVNKGNKVILTIQHKGLYVEGMTGRRSFTTNVGESLSEDGLKANMKRTGHTRISTHLGYIHERQDGKKKTKKSLFGVSKIKKN